MEPSELISNLLNQVNVGPSGKCEISNNSLTSQQTLPELCQIFGLDLDGNNTAIVSYTALTQILQHVTGVVVLFGSIDFNGNSPKIKSSLIF